MTPMQLGTQAELDILGLAVTAGAAMGLIYGLFQIVARLLNFAAVRLICDLTYTLMFGAVYFVFTLAQTNYLRGFVLLGMIGGAAGWPAPRRGRASRWPTGGRKPPPPA